VFLHQKNLTRQSYGMGILFALFCDIKESCKMTEANLKKKGQMHYVPQNTATCYD
jgi:hypothetical protein